MRTDSQRGIVVKTVLLTITLILINGLAVLQLIGIGGSDYQWESFKALAQTYISGRPDVDGDGLADDGGDPRTDFNDPSGCFYELGTGRIIAGGSVTTTATPLSVADTGSDGCFQFINTNTIGVIALTVTPPTGWRRVPTCIPPFSPCPTGATCSNGDLRIRPDNPPETIVLGALVNALNPAFLESGGCTPFYPEIETVEDGGVTANNIALVRVNGAPAMDTAALGALLVLLAGIGLMSLRARRRAEP